MKVLLLTFLVLGVTIAQYTCPPKSTEFPGYVELTRSDGACDYRAYMGPNEHNSSYLEILLEGNQEGWVAIGFSGDQNMALTDVLGCKQDPSGAVGVFNTWNGQRPPNELDPSQDGMCTYEAVFTEGAFSCHFSRFHGVINPGYDYDLRENFYFLLGCSTNQNKPDEGFAFHTPNNPLPTSEQYNAFTFNGSIPSAEKPVFERRMIRAHGIFMVIAYPVLMVTAAFFAAWMKPSLPKLWFPIHVSLMITSLATGLLAFALVFIANKDNPTPGIINLKDCGAKTTHFVFGIAVVAFQVLNPIIAIFRCKPNDQNRWIFNLIHGGSIGLLTELLALTNIALGAVIFQSNCSKLTSGNAMLYLYIAWCVMLVSIQAFLYVYFTVKTFQGDEESAPLLVKIYFKFFGTPQYESINTDKTTPTQENKIRYGVFCFQLGLSLLIGLILIVFIAVDNFI